MKRFILAVAVYLSLGGCATIGSIDYGYKRIDLADGINKNEAKLLAKKKILDDKTRSAFVIIGPDVYDLDHEIAKVKSKSGAGNFTSELYDGQGHMRYPGCYAVVFRPKPFPFSFCDEYYLVIIDKMNGEVKSSLARNSLVDLFMAPVYITMGILDAVVSVVVPTTTQSVSK